MAGAREVGHPVGVQDLAALGRRINELRERKGLSQAEAARRAGVTAAYWSMVEGAKPNTATGRPSAPTVVVLRAIAEELDADRAELLELAGHVAAANFERERQAQVAPPADEVDPQEYARLEELVRRMVHTELQAVGIEPTEAADEEQTGESAGRSPGR